VGAPAPLAGSAARPAAIALLLPARRGGGGAWLNVEKKKEKTTKTNKKNPKIQKSRDLLGPAFGQQMEQALF